jgi:hypothetical protein
VTEVILQLVQYSGEIAAGTNEIRLKKYNTDYLETGNKFIIHP